ncbi:hypothetical protein ACIRVK_13675 [Streptomyces sp. NPDC101152]|uniref:hypothetical protein n=1 Tax=Streptomyces sp. NPDC101152 TaxID=3366116 RepID=UPI0037FD3FD6
MGQITPEMRAKYPRIIDYFTADVVGKLDQAEVLDRCDEAQRLYEKAFADSTPRELVWGHLERAQAVCKAAPRDETELAVQEWTAKAQTAHTNIGASAYLEKADEIRRANPQAPRMVRPREKTAAEVEAEQNMLLLKADVAKAAVLEKARQAAADALYKEQLAGRAQWTVGAELRWRREQGPAS